MSELGLVHIGLEGAAKACANARLLRVWQVQLGTPFAAAQSQNVPSLHGMFQLEGMQ
ncbi:UNVERIFIED_CONTAM: hypothetical protein NO986_14840 [Comamonas sp. A-3]|uniref:hypothetical protein n=1 Tax=unclassified Comamonas TaxID=2638500 RepID=UPI000C6899DE|nr:hypothetical protein [Comamonas sp. 26]PIG08982.1 hypothetical protein CLU84_1862 [Comamonas sp. 26]